ncbi:hypothetical protein N182_11820 [Sinorhizobium sp. GL2]|nr:hypothetical protein N182_11820 [Sinorhizobium sp. GL2]
MIGHGGLDLRIQRKLGKIMLSSFAVPVEPEDKEKELLALARLVTYARDSAKTLNVEGVNTVSNSRSHRCSRRPRTAAARERI